MGCLPVGTELLLSSTKLRVADEILTLPPEAALENEQIDKAMAAMGVAQNQRYCGQKSLEHSLCSQGWGATCQGLFAGEFKDDCEILQQQTDLEPVIRHRHGNTPKLCSPRAAHS